MGLAVYALTLVVWLAVFSPALDEIEPIETAFTVLALVFSGGTALLVTRLDLPVLEAGWGLLAYSFYVRLLDEIAEGPETLESLLPSTIQLIALGIILLGFVRTTSRLRSNLAEQDERLTVLNRVLRHNLRNDLSVVIMALNRARERATSDREVESATRGLRKANDLHELGEKLRETDVILENAGANTEPTDVNTVVESKVEEFRAEYPAVEFAVRTSPDAPVTTADGIDAAIDNVIENACEHNDADDPAVDVTVKAETANVAVTVRDNGTGIPSHELIPIRERDESALSHGSGVGLWFVLWVVERAGGDVSFDDSDGQSVTLRFPRPATGGRLLRLSITGR